jgi:hypothetical protein
VAHELTPEYLDVLRRMTGQEKLRTAISLYWSARNLKSVAVRRQHPDWSEERVQERVKQVFLDASS